MFRQGDILIREQSAGHVHGAQDPREMPGHPLTVGYGETGNVHVLQKARVDEGRELAAELFARANVRAESVSEPIYVERETELEHGEHRSLAVPAGTYRAIRQRQYAGSRPTPAFD